MNAQRIAVTAIVTAGLAGSAQGGGIYGFFGLRDYNSAGSVTDDGRVFLSRSSFGGYLWTPTGGAVQINGGYYGRLSPDGAYCVGQDSGGAYWQQIGSPPQRLPPPPGGFNDAPTAVTSNGVAVGTDTTLNRACRWPGPMPGMPIAPVFSEANDISRDGQRIVGRFNAVPFMYAEGVGLQTFGTFNNRQVTEFRAFSGDGRVVVGDAYDGGTAWQGEAFRWTSGGGFVSLGGIGTVPGTPNQQYFALAVNDDGSLIGGTQGDRRAWIWDPQHGMRDLRDVLVNQYHYDLTNWTLEQVLDISADGRYLVGEGVYHNGGVNEFRAFVAIIPAPPSAIALVALLTVALARRRRQRGPRVRDVVPPWRGQ